MRPRIEGMSDLMRNRYGNTARWMACGMVVLSAWGGAGCEGPQGKSLMRANVRFARTSENVIKIHKFFATEPWLRFRRDAELDRLRDMEVLLRKAGET